MTTYSELAQELLAHHRGVRLAAHSVVTEVTASRKVCDNAEHANNTRASTELCDGNGCLRSNRRLTKKIQQQQTIFNLTLDSQHEASMVQIEALLHENARLQQKVIDAYAATGAL
uniref:Uncharacterized protein n=1 Tax=viral metagenome TaxID=1070528 RepID=A0A6C0KDM6_9ZZZZ